MVGKRSAIMLFQYRRCKLAGGVSCCSLSHHTQPFRGSLDISQVSYDQFTPGALVSQPPSASLIVGYLVAP